MGDFPNKDTQFKAGNPGGPGRPLSLKTAIQEALVKERDVKNKDGVVVDKKQAIVLMVEAQVNKAINNKDTRAFEALSKAAFSGEQPVALTGAEGGPIETREVTDAELKARMERLENDV